MYYTRGCQLATCMAHEAQAASLCSMWQIEEESGSTVADRAGNKKQGPRSHRGHRARGRKQNSRLGKRRGLECHMGRA